MIVAVKKIFTKYVNKAWKKKKKLKRFKFFVVCDFYVNFVVVKIKKKIKKKCLKEIILKAKVGWGSFVK